jgi:hypothetical protein
MINIIDQRLQSIKHMHSNFFGDLDVIVIDNFYQAPPIWNKWVFQIFIKALTL